MTIIQDLRRALPDLPKKLALAAEYAIDKPDRIALDSMRTSATAVGVTSPTMLRLARHLGFESYETFRARFQDELVQTGFGTRAGALRRRSETQDGNRALLERMHEAQMDNLNAASTGIDTQALTQIVTLLHRAPSVHLVGTGSLFWLAAMMKTTGSMVLSNLRLVGSEFAVASEGLGHLSPQDVVVTLGVNPCAARTIEALRFANAAGSTTVALVDNAASPLAVEADFYLCAPSRSPHYYPSMVSMTMLVELVLATALAEGPEETLDRINDLEARRRQSSAYHEY